MKKNLSSFLGATGALLLTMPSANAALIATADTVGTGVGQVTLSGGTTLVGGVLTFITPGTSSTVGDSARINGIPGFNGDEDWTVVFWANHTLGPDRNMVAFDANKMSIRTDVWNEGTGTRFRVDAQGGDRSPTTGVIDLTTATDFHYAVVNDATAGELRLYTNGTLVEALALTSWTLANTGGIHLGDYAQGGKPGMAGTMSGFGLYDEVLSATAFQGLTVGQRPISIPEPGVALLGGLGVLMLLIRRKRD